MADNDDSEFGDESLADAINEYFDLSISQNDLADALREQFAAPDDDAGQFPEDGSSDYIGIWDDTAFFYADAIDPETLNNIMHDSTLESYAAELDMQSFGERMMEEYGIPISPHFVPDDMDWEDFNDIFDWDAWREHWGYND